MPDSLNSQSRRRHSRSKLAPLTLEEVMSYPGMSGFDTVAKQLAGIVSSTPDADWAPAAPAATATPEGSELSVGLEVPVPVPTVGSAPSEHSVPIEITVAIEPTGGFEPPVTSKPTEVLDEVMRSRQEWLPSEATEGSVPIEPPASADKLHNIIRLQDDVNSRTSEGLEPSEPTEDTEGSVTTEVTAQLQPPGAGYHVYRCWVVQDGHSTTEDRIYNALWSLKLKQLNPKIRQYVYIRLDGEDKLVSIGFRVLARFLKMQPKVVKRCLRSLAEKRSIAFDLQYNVSSQQAFTYRIYSFSKILRLREEAGLLWATRNRGGVIFVAKPVGYIEGDELRTSEGLEPSEPTEDTEGTDAPEGGPTQGTPSAGSMASPSEGSKPPRITDTNVRHYNQTDDQTRIPAGLAAVLIAVFGVVDDNYLQQLVKACRQVAPDVTDQELIDVMTVKAAEIANGKSNSPKAVLLRAAPVCFKGESFQQLRRIRATAISKPPSVDDDHWWAGLSPEGVQSRLAMYQELAANPKSLNHEFAKKQLAKFEGREGN